MKIPDDLNNRPSPRDGSIIFETGLVDKKQQRLEIAPDGIFVNHNKIIEDHELYILVNTFFTKVLKKVNITYDEVTANSDIFFTDGKQKVEIFPDGFYINGKKTIPDYEFFLIVKKVFNLMLENLKNGDLNVSHL